MSIEALKKQARAFEQKEDWESALTLYHQAIEQLDQEEEHDIALYNRVGDLEVRVGHIEKAVQHYEEAVDLYVRAELPNNAIAVCKKVVRNLPGRDSIFLKMGQIRARQGFLTDARHSFLTYAERKQAAGDLEEAFRALIEFVELAPEDIEIRLALAAQLAQHERADEAVEQFKEARRRMIIADRSEEAESLVEKIREIDPNAALEDAETIRSQAPAPRAPASSSRDPWDTGYTGFGLADETVTEPEAAGVEGDSDLETTPDFAEISASAEVEEEVEEETEIELEDGAVTLDGDADDGGLADDAGDEEVEGEELPLMEFDVPGDLETLETVGPEEEAGAGASVGAAAGAGAGAAGEDGESLKSEGERLLSSGDDAGWALLDRAHGLLAEEGMAEEAVAVARRVAEERPDDVALRQRVVEYAYRMQDEGVLVSAFLELAGALRRTGESQKALAVYQQVLETDPGNEEAASALADRSESQGVRDRPRPEVASSEEYVDLGSMILGDEPEEKSTRFVVAAEAPSGDEAADFAKMLSQFKEKVAENLDTGDVAAHYDLGTAYKEMGLLDEAISEFQAALRASRDHLPTYEMLGQCFLEKDQGDVAVRTLEKALTFPFEVEDELLGIYYYLGRANEAMSRKETALEFYEKVFALDINFMDVTDRLRELR